MLTIRVLARVVAAAAAAGAMLGGCASQAVTPTSSPERPGIQIDDSFQRGDGEWTFTGRVDPQGAATDVVLEIRPGPSTGMVFTSEVVVGRTVGDPAPLSITTRNIPDIGEVCVRFKATNSAGTTASVPLCFAPVMPSIVPDDLPPATAFLAPAFGTVTVLDQTTYTVSWTESEAGSGIVRRALQRRVATYVAGTCGAYVDDGPASTVPSPLAVSDLLDGQCYEWTLSLSDHAGNTSASTSGSVRVALANPG